MAHSEKRQLSWNMRVCALTFCFLFLLGSKEKSNQISKLKKWSQKKKKIDCN